MVEIAWKNDGIDREEIVIAAPERNGLGTDETDGTLRIAIVDEPGKVMTPMRVMTPLLLNC